ncbi:MAG: RAMP superfamily CRISPR-associated protein [Candidatus Hodarchaeota archaeon]
MINNILIKYSVQFLTPFHFGTGLSSGTIDRIIRRDANGYLIVPATTIKGVLREKLEILIELFKKLGFFSESFTKIFKTEEQLNFFRDTSLVDRIFGSPTKEGTLYFDDLKMSDASKELVSESLLRGEKVGDYLQTQQRTQIRIWRKLKTVSGGALFKSEYGNPQLFFDGEIKGQLDGVKIQLSSIQNMTYELLLLILTLKMADKFGGNKSTGMGKVLIEIEQVMLNEKELKLNQILSEEIWENLEVMFNDDLEVYKNEN